MSSVASERISSYSETSHPRKRGRATAEELLLAAVPSGLRSDVMTLLTSPRLGGRGLRAWVALIEVGHPPLESELPRELLEVYLQDQEAEPLHDCEECGIPVPVRCHRRRGREPVAEREYFPECPRCGGKTGRFAFWSRRMNSGPSHQF